MAETPDVYSDAVSVQITGVDVLLEFVRRSAKSGTSEGPEAVVYVRMSMEAAKAFSIVLKENLKRCEAIQGAPIPIHPQIRQMLQISKNEDW